MVIYNYKTNEEEFDLHESNNRAYLQQEIKVLNEYQSFLSNDSYQATISTEERNQLSSITEKASNMMIAP